MTIAILVSTVCPTGLCGPDVTTTVDTFNWIDYHISALGGQPVIDGLVQKFAARSDGPTLSTSFSGIGAPEIAGRLLLHYLRAKSAQQPCPALGFRCLAALDWNEHSRDELMWDGVDGRYCPTHLFVDQCEFINDRVRKKLVAKVDSGTLTPSELWHMLLLPGAVSRHAHCKNCQRRCCWPFTNMHVAGSPCTDFSGMPGAKQTGVAGKSGLAMLTWAALMRQVEPSILWHENVPEFPDMVLQWLFGDMFIIMSLVVDLMSLGFPCRRRRRLSLLMSKKNVPLPSPRWDLNFVAKFYRNLTRITFRHFLLASQEEQDEELARMVKPKKNSSHNRTKLARSNATMMRSDDVRKHRFVQIMTEWEVRNLRSYRRQFPGCAYMISQDAVAAPNRSDRIFMLCQTMGQFMVFSDLDHRWLLWREFLVFQGWPLYDALKPDWLNDFICGFDVPRPGRDPVRVVEQSGNSIPLPILSIVWLYTFVCADICANGSTSSTAMSSTAAVAPSSSSTSAKRRRTLKEALSLT